MDICRPGHMTACLRNFQETIKSNDDNWDAYFGALDIAALWPSYRSKPVL